MFFCELLNIIPKPHKRSRYINEYTGFGEKFFFALFSVTQKNIFSSKKCFSYIYELTGLQRAF